MTAEPIPAPLDVRAWWEPELATTGHDPLGPYPEQYWLPVLGPSATLALRWLVRELRQNPEGYQVSMSELARGLGLGTAKGRNGPAIKALDRLCYFGLARHGQTFDVRTHVPFLAPHLERRLPPATRDRHRGLMTRRSTGSPVAPGPPVKQVRASSTGQASEGSPSGSSPAATESSAPQLPNN